MLLDVCWSLLEWSQILLPLIIIALLVWKSTDTPQDLPVPPQPFLISLVHSQTQLSLSDVRLHSTAPLLSSLSRSPPPSFSPFSLFTRFFSWRRPLLRSRRIRAPTNFIAYHRFFQRHRTRPVVPPAQVQPQHPVSSPVTQTSEPVIPQQPQQAEAPQSPPVISVMDSGDDAVGASGQEVKFTLKFLDDRQVEIVTSQGEKIGDFKRRQFASELQENKTVRLIFNGRVLEEEGKTLREAGIFDHCVVHCLVVSPQRREESGGSGVAGRPAAPRGPEPGLFFVSLLGILLLVLWFVCFSFGQQLFTQSAVVSLSVLTAIFLVGLVAFSLPTHPPNIN